MNPLFSIIIPVYNVEKYLADCLNSVINQSFKDYEIICINDGSTDTSGSILNQFALTNKQIMVIEQENRGLSLARNMGIKASNGNYLLFLDSDDWIENNTLEILQRTISKQDIVCFNGRKNTRILESDGIDTRKQLDYLNGWDYYNKNALLEASMHFDCSVTRIYRREFIVDNNLFFKVGILHEDTLFTTLVCYAAKDVSVISDYLYVYREREGSITKTKNKKRLIDRIKIANILSDLFMPIDNVDKSIVYRAIAGLYFGLYNSGVLRKHGGTFLDLRKEINWHNYKVVSTYPRHKRIYRLIRIHPWLYYLYLKLEMLSRHILNKRDTSA